jgi:hypothetical protein
MTLRALLELVHEKCESFTNSILNAELSSIGIALGLALLLYLLLRDKDSEAEEEVYL